MGICCISQGIQMGALYQPGGLGWGGTFKREGTYVHLWLIHVDVWQKTIKFCKAINLQLKNKEKKSKDRPHPSQSRRQKYHIRLWAFILRCFMWQACGMPKAHWPSEYGGSHLQAFSNGGNSISLPRQIWENSSRFLFFFPSSFLSVLFSFS